MFCTRKAYTLANKHLFHDSVSRRGPTLLHLKVVPFHSKLATTFEHPAEPRGRLAREGGGGGLGYFRPAQSEEHRSRPL